MGKEVRERERERERERHHVLCIWARPGPPVHWGKEGKVGGKGEGGKGVMRKCEKRKSHPPLCF